MKYSMDISSNNPDDWKLLRYGELAGTAKANPGEFDNAHLEFWQEIEDLRAELAKEKEARTNLENLAQKAGVIDGNLITDLQNKIKNLTATNAVTTKKGRAMNVIDQIITEVARATVKFPTWPTDPLHALAVLGEEFGELTKAMLQHTYEPHKGVTQRDIREEAIQTAAMALRLAMSLDRYEYRRGEQHKQGGELGRSDERDIDIDDGC